MNAHLLALALLAPAATAQTGPALPYDAGALVAEKSAQQLLADAEAAVLAGRYAEAKPLVERLASFPEYALQFNFLQGYIALETGDAVTAEQRFRAAAALAPEYTRARIELGRALLAQGKRAEADEQYKLAGQDPNLSPELAALVRQGRAKSAERAIWYLNVDASVIADSNINNATDLDAVPVNFGDVTLPVELDPAFQSQAGLGFGKSAAGGVKLRASEAVALSVDGEASIVDYQDAVADDISLLLAAGAELTFEGGVAAVQATLFQREYGGLIANEGFGLRARYQRLIDADERVTLYLDARIFESGYGEAYEGEQASAYLVYEVVFEPDLSGNITLYGRREWLGFDPFSNFEFGSYGGFNAYLSEHLAAGVSLGLTRVLFDDPFLTLSPQPRRDWRAFGSVYIATRNPAFLGITPSLSYSFNRTFSNVGFYRADRHRLRLGLAKSF
ncbi:MAG TPA: surface lipoprotein assembly modifier [Allosphingosinicella sp.]|jgi:Tfp pilus assembly protein PilF|uniref:tetratricopeptide repeat protein n=1 Tax=Allosphingosinicella sp. TaxID=2823234 RepID=UPI002F2969D0